MTTPEDTISLPYERDILDLVAALEKRSARAFTPSVMKRVQKDLAKGLTWRAREALGKRKKRQQVVQALLAAAKGQPSPRFLQACEAGNITSEDIDEISRLTFAALSRHLKTDFTLNQRAALGRLVSDLKACPYIQ